ncbi:MAG: radical SAM protein [Pseudomonadota bacterium]
MKVFAKSENKNLATVYLAEFENKKRIEFVESIQPPFSREEKWVLILSTLFGCPVNCPICDASQRYEGKLSKEQILDQIDYMVNLRYPNKIIPAKKLKIQFARMGEPSFNKNVLEALKALPERYNAPGLFPCISTVAPIGTEEFFEQLIKIKNAYYKGTFQLQFSIHSTNQDQRDKLIPVKKWSFNHIVKYSNEFWTAKDRKITLNFALLNNVEIDSNVLKTFFDPEKFLIKITPINPTYKTKENNLADSINFGFSIDQNNKIQTDKVNSQITKIKEAGFDVILSIGELEENQIGSNCGQYLISHLNNKKNLEYGYKQKINDI